MNIKKYIVLHAEEVRKLMLSDRQRAIVRTVTIYTNMNASKLAGMLNISSFNASTQLGNLYKKGYLKREQAPDPTGGYLYIYSIDF